MTRGRKGKSPPTRSHGDQGKSEEEIAGSGRWAVYNGRGRKKNCVPFISFGSNMDGYRLPLRTKM